jgi:hypothetical protein
MGRGRKNFEYHRAVDSEEGQIMSDLTKLLLVAVHIFRNAGAGVAFLLRSEIA